MQPATSCGWLTVNAVSISAKVFRKSSVPVPLEDEVRAEHEPDVAEHVDDERLDAGRGRRRAAIPERDQEVGRGADERPADDQQEEVRRQDQQQHAEHEEVQVGEEARVAAVAAHVGDRVEVDQRRDARDDQAHHRRERVDQDRELRVDADACSRSPSATETTWRCLLAAVLSARNIPTAHRNEAGSRACR